ncbi:hypothetical protein [Planotetraspora mira]|uniref:Uncharacterized protein n=1 Tax=Planotetraspora mira TaxID=58121 RepID=A0A8J3TVD9_9ACTN|nr:hypothetical protein [Planotetraspora mira]GII33009.1 hypothetical protein Pmi06nite_64510 [Planotetraspora mira]
MSWASDEHADLLCAASAPPVTVLLDPQDERAVIDAALGAHAPHLGCVTVHPTPAASGDLVLAHDLLFALGKRAIPLTVEQLPDSSSAWAAVATWIRIAQITMLVVLRAHLLSARCWRLLLELRSATGVHLVLVHHRRNIATALRGQLTGVDYRISLDPGSELPAPPTARAATGPTDPRGGTEVGGAFDQHDQRVAALPHTVATSLPWYRADAYRRLSAAEFARVDAEYRHGLQAACQWLRRHTPSSPAQILPHGITTGLFDDLTLADHVLGRLPAMALPALNGSPGCYPYPTEDLAGLQGFLSGLVADAPTPGHAVARIRGAQAAFLRHGLLLSPPEDLTTAHGPGLGVQGFTHLVADQIRRQIAHPGVAAALTLALITGAPASVVAQLSIQAMDDEAGTVTVGRDRFGIPRHGRDLVVAAKLFGRLAPVRAGQRLVKVIGRDGVGLEAAADVCGVRLEGDAFGRHVHRPWHVLTGCWRVGRSLHDRDGDSGLCLAADQQGHL